MGRYLARNPFLRLVASLASPRIFGRLSAAASESGRRDPSLADFPVVFAPSLVGLSPASPDPAASALRRPQPDRQGDAGSHLCDAGLGTQCRGRIGGPARSRLCRLLRRRRLFLCAAVAQFRPVLLDLPAPGWAARGNGGHDARLPRSSPARRLPRHRHPGLRRDRPDHPAQLAVVDRRAQWHRRYSPAQFLRPALHLPSSRRAAKLRRLFRPGLFARPPHHLPVLPDLRAGARHQPFHAPHSPFAARPRLGGAARGRDRLPQPRPQSHHHQAVGLRHRRHVRRPGRIASSPPARASSARRVSTSSNRR